MLVCRFVAHVRVRVRAVVAAAIKQLGPGAFESSHLDCRLHSKRSAWLAEKIAVALGLRRCKG